MKTCGDQGTRFEFECYDTAHLYNLAHFLERGLVQPPLFIQTVFGLLGGIGADVDDLLHLRRTALRLFGDDFDGRRWAPGRAIPLRTIALALGATSGRPRGLAVGRTRQAGRVQPRAGRADQVGRRVLHREVATPAEARRAPAPAVGPVTYGRSPGARENPSARQPT